LDQQERSQAHLAALFFSTTPYSPSIGRES
jgi:hypothetical protein